jgi:hypothetical protein
MTTTTPQIFGQLQPTNTASASLLYQAPIYQQAQATVFVCNQTIAPEQFRIALVPRGTTIETANYIAYDTPLIGNGVFALSSIGLNSGDAIWVKSALGNLSFTATGIEFSV